MAQFMLWLGRASFAEKETQSWGLPKLTQKREEGSTGGECPESFCSTRNPLFGTVQGTHPPTAPTAPDLQNILSWHHLLCHH